jgi:hypothetical protein
MEVVYADLGAVPDLIVSEKADVLVLACCVLVHFPALLNPVKLCRCAAIVAVTRMAVFFEAVVHPVAVLR